MSANDGSEPLASDLQERFCLEYIKDLNGSRAARDAGSPAKSAPVNASRWLKSANVKARLAYLTANAVAKADNHPAAIRQETREELAREADESIEAAAEVITELRNLSFSNLVHFIEVQPNGNILVRDLSALPPAIQRQLRKVKAKLHTYTDEGETHVEAEYEVELFDKVGTLKLLAQHYALLGGAAGKQKPGDGIGEDAVVEITMDIPKASG
jgi:phage terminase small subunit